MEVISQKAHWDFFNCRPKKSCFPIFCRKEMKEQILVHQYIFPSQFSECNGHKLVFQKLLYQWQIDSCNYAKNSRSEEFVL
ncbi:hypothetical protein GDO81_003431 [Engystomops pustulosus]|uniref:Uncharacterized protein n=1 Tax=Engystomops pustulosus TaxID=76066 RepID=A0AAV7A157_ENGPU|nr:hypothetical protein GDO81_003431 [Engystomops pustulosus]